MACLDSKRHSLGLSISMNTYTYMCTHTCICVYIYIRIHILRGARTAVSLTDSHCPCKASKASKPVQAHGVSKHGCPNEAKGN